MARLTDQEITNLLLARKYKAIDLTNYRNKDSQILVQCDHGHIFSASLKELEKPRFRCPQCVGAEFSESAKKGILPEKQKYRIVAFDQSSENLGVSIYDDGKLTYYDWYRLTGELDERLSKWFKLLNDTVIPIWKPDFLVFEDIQYQKDKGITTFKVLAQVLGVAKAAATLNKIPYTCVLNKTWQADFNIAGSTRAAQKHNVIERVRQYFNIEVSDDVGDAILIGRYMANRMYDNWLKEEF